MSDTDKKAKGITFLIVLGLAVAGTISYSVYSWYADRAAEKSARTEAEKTKKYIAAYAARIMAEKPKAISDALALAPTDPAVGIARLQPYLPEKDPAAIAAINSLEAALKAKRVAMAKEYLKAGEPERANDEIRAYLGIAATPEISEVIAKISSARARSEKQELASRKNSGVSIGMTMERVLQSSWGKPAHVNRTTNVRGVSEQWVYRGSGSYLYFENGILTSIQN